MLLAVVAGAPLIVAIAADVKEPSASAPASVPAGTVPVAVAPSSANPLAGPFAARELSMQVWALQALRDLDLTQRQLRSLRTIVPSAVLTESTPQRRVPLRYVNALKALRDALVKGDDSERIDDLQDDAETIADDLDIDVDDSVVVTDAARACMPVFMRLLTSSQIVAYLAEYEDEAPDPVATLMEAASDVRGTSQAEFDELAGDTARDIGILVAGIDPAKYEPVSAKVKEWLRYCRSLGRAEFDNSSAELEKQATALMGGVDAFMILRHWVERDLSELLANPQLAAVLDARLARLAVTESRN